MKDLIQKAMHQVNEKLKNHPKRLKHVYGVAQTAVSLANHYGVDANKMMLAGLYHDFAKYDDIDTKLLTNEEVEVVEAYPVMFHAYQAAYLMTKQLNVNDMDIINSIKCHVWGKPNMNIYEKILFVSDYCEPNRTFLDTTEIFELAKSNLNKAVLKCMEISIKDLEKRALKPSINQLEAYDYYKEVSLWIKN
jgi:predicted HD superfamily hydrolase involved in NAD metabolism